MTPPPGWYPYVDGTSRYWDGTAWTEHVSQVPLAPKGRYPNTAGRGSRYWDGHNWARRPGRRLTWAVSAGAFLCATLIVTSLLTPAVAHAQPALVERVVDGDTVDVRVEDGETVRIRLLNIDTPETVDPDRPVECLGTEASAFTQSLLPAGTEITLEFDREREDQYGRTLAAITLGDGRNVSVELARQGLGAPVVYGGNDRFADEVRGASKDAKRHERGLFSRERECTLPAQMQAAEALAEHVESSDLTTSSGAELESLVSEVEVLSSALAALASQDRYELWSVFEAATTRAYESQISDLSDRADEAVASIRGEMTARAEAEEAARIQAEQEAKERTAREKAERQAREEAERRAVEEAQRAEAARQTAEREAAERRAREQQSTPDSGSSGGSTSGSGGSSGVDPRYDGYTGCRAYVPSGTSIDEKGRRYNKIPCP